METGAPLLSYPTASSKNQGKQVLQFAPWQSSVEAGFWERLASYKINTAQLSEAPRNIIGFFAPANHAQFPSPFCLSAESFSSVNSGEPGVAVAVASATRCPVPGVLHNFNTIEKFKEADKGALLKSTGQQIWDDIRSGRAEADPSLLNRFLLISFADLKKWSFYYWFGFPGLVLPEPAKAGPPKKASDVFTREEAGAVQVACENWRRGRGKSGSAQLEDGNQSSFASSASTPGAQAFLLHVTAESSAQAYPLLTWKQLSGQGGQVVLAFYDPCHLAANPGWPLRNLLALAVARWQVRTLRVVCLRERRGRPDLQQCPVFDIALPDLPEWRDRGACPDAVGWERNSKGKNGPRFADLAPSMDPTRLAMSAADLNLKLMRWRLLPSLDLPRLASTRCLILGAGTLGCQVARGLMAWGIRHITFVDYGRVAMSNPLRQSLYMLEDCLEGGQPKAQAAANSVTRIYPGMEARGIQMAIPMPGHPVRPEEEESVRGACRQLEHLVQEHDCVFLGTDTRESRWLPTVLCAAYRKMAINAALGFDTFLVMRHGASPQTIGAPSSHPHVDHGGEDQPEAATTAAEDASVAEGENSTVDVQDSKTGEEEALAEGGGKVRESGNVRRAPRDGPHLGCYFCNDVVAPLDSTANRSLDQQCTVTRPGLAPMAAALAVELAVSLLHHPLGINAPADPATDITASTALPLGIVPHQVRGFLAHFTQLVVTGQAFDKCTACSAKVIMEYEKRGLDFLLRVFNEPTYLEDLTGLTEMLSATPAMDFDWDDEEGEMGDVDDFVEL